MKIFLLVLSGFISISSFSESSELKKSSPLRGSGLQFVQNKGQVVDINHKQTPDILFKGNDGSTDIYLRKNGMSFVLSDGARVLHEVDEELEEAEENENSNLAEEQRLRNLLIKKKVMNVHRVDVDFLNCNTSAEIIKKNQVEGCNNYYYGYLPKGVTQVNSFNEVRFKNLYKNIDVDYYGSKSDAGLKYDIIVNPGGNPNNIKLKYSGAEKIELREGHLIISTSIRPLGEYMPKVYQQINGRIAEVQAEYILSSNEKAEYFVTFRIANYNSSFPLIIDPWSTYYGGSINDAGYSVTADKSADNAIFCGSTYSSDFPLLGATQTSLNGANDGMIVKFTGTGTRVFATYFGGSGGEIAHNVTTDISGNIFIGGETNSNDLPILNLAGAYNNSIYGGSTDGFVAKLSPTGTLLWSTYFGGSGTDGVYDIAVDNSGNISLVGSTSSSNIPIVAAYKSTLTSAFETFVSKLNSSGAIVWSTYFGDAFTVATAFDPAGATFIAGQTYSATNFPLVSAFQNVYGGNGDIIVAKLDLNGFPVWSTYMGGLALDYAEDIDVDPSGNVYISGSTSSPTQIASAGSYQPNLASAYRDAFLARFDNVSGTRIWSTYIGGGLNEENGSVACDVNGNVIIVGDTYSKGGGNGAMFPVTACSHDTTFAGSESNFMATFDSNGKLICSGNFGGFGFGDNETKNFLGHNVAVKGCYLYVFAETPLPGLPYSAGSFQPSINPPISGTSYADCYLAKLYLYNCASFDFTPSATVVCPGQPTSFTNTSCVTSFSSAATYTWSFPGATPTTSTVKNPANIVYPASGNYAVKMIVQLPCGKDSVEKTINITVKNVSAATSLVSNTTCNGNSDGSANVTISNGSGGIYTYSWSNGSSGTTTATAISATGLSATIYTVTITDASCTVASTISITQPPVITTNPATIANASCGASNGNVVANVSGGTGTFTYSWSNASTGQTAINLSAGSYQVTVTDNKGCSKTQSVSISNSPGPTINSINPSPILCWGNNTGAAVVSATGTGSLSYSWSNTASGLTASGLSAGNYSVTVTDGNGCVAIQTVSITQPSVITLLVTQNIPAACGNSNGVAVASASGGNTTSYDYKWNNNATGTTASGLAAGNYTVTVTDGNGCTKSTTTTIINSGGPSISSITATNPLCSGSTGTAVVAASGGTGALSYSWSASAGITGVTATNLSNGTYTVTVYDTNGCSSTSAVVITAPSAITANATQTAAATCGNSNGTAVASAAGGSGTFTFSWSSGAIGQTANNLPAGTYVVTVTDNNACTTSQSVSINNNPAPTINSVTPINILCKGNSTGSAVVSASGNGTLTYSWSAAGASSSTVNNLTTGTYTITVTDGNGCQAISTIAITEPTNSVTINSINPVNSTCGNANGSATVNVTGGTGALTYSWSAPILATGATATNLSANSYVITVADNNGCNVSQGITIINSPGPTINSVTPSNPLCNAGKGSAVVAASGGTGSLLYSWSTTATGATETNLSNGTFTVTVTDINNCASTATVTISVPSQINVAALQTAPSTCGNNNGAAVASASGGSGTLTYNWSNSAAGQTATNLNAATYIVTVTDANGCLQTTSVSITNSAGPIITSVNANNPNCSGGTGTATATISGGTGNLTYSWNTGASSITTSITSQITNLISNTYTVTVMDANACSFTSTVTISVPLVITESAVQKTAATCGSANGIATVSATGGTGPFSYTWSNSATGQTAGSLVAGSYTVTASDANNCTQSTTVIVTNSGGPAFNSLAASNPLCFGGMGSATAIASGGIGNLTYSWSNSASGQTATNLTAGTYTVTVNDANNCPNVSTVTINIPAALTTGCSQLNPASCGNANGVAVANGSGGTGSISYSWNNSATGPTSNSLVAGNYTVTATDANGCTKSSTVTITNSAGPTITTVNASNPLCAMGAGSATAMVSGGTGNLTYSWSTGTSSVTTALSSQIANLVSNIYTVTVIDKNGCSNASTVTITIPPVMNANAVQLIGASCGSNNGSATVVAAGGVGGYSYSWSNGPTAQTAGSFVAGNYTVTVTDANACTQTTTVAITSLSGPAAMTNVSSTIACKGGAGSVSVAAVGGVSPYTYSWSNGTSSVTTASTSQISNLLSAIYTVTIKDAGGCSIVSTVDLSQPNALIVTATKTDAGCANNNGIITALASGGSTPYSYTWSNGESQIKTINLSAGNYSVTIADANGCTATTSVQIISTGGTVLNTSPALQAISEGTSVSLSVSGGTTYTWSPATSLNCTNCTNPIATPIATTTYTVSAIDANGCLLSAMITIKVKPACIGEDEDVFIANVFSPNNDGINDIVYIDGNGLTNIYWAIYDRWGNLLFESFDQSIGWDGTQRGNKMETGTYVYYLKATCIKTNTEVKLKGNISIVK